MKIQTKIKWAVAFTLLASSFFFTGVAFASYLGLGYFSTNQMGAFHLS